jgi:hypothetical protein
MYAVSNPSIIISENWNGKYKECSGRGVVCGKILVFSWRAEENYDKSRSEWLVYRLRFELNTFRMEVRGSASNVFFFSGVELSP